MLDGVGKTFLAHALGHIVCRRQRSGSIIVTSNRGPTSGS